MAYNWKPEVDNYTFPKIWSSRVLLLFTPAVFRVFHIRPLPTPVQRRAAFVAGLNLLWNVCKRLWSCSILLIFGAGSDLKTVSDANLIIRFWKRVNNFAKVVARFSHALLHGQVAILPITLHSPGTSVFRGNSRICSMVFALNLSRWSLSRALSTNLNVALYTWHNSTQRNSKILILASLSVVVGSHVSRFAGFHLSFGGEPQEKVELLFSSSKVS